MAEKSTVFGAGLRHAYSHKQEAETAVDGLVWHVPSSKKQEARVMAMTMTEPLARIYRGGALTILH